MENLRERLLAGIPVAERRMRLAGVSTALLQGGEGPPLILMHGGIEGGGVVWAPVLSGLARNHHIVVPDAPGLGESESLRRMDQAMFDDWLTELLRLIPDEKPTLLAHSLGGTFAARFAARHGSRLRALIIYGAPGIGRYRMPPGLMLTAIRFSLRPTLRNQERFERWAFFDVDHTKRRDVEWFEAFDSYTVSRGRVRHVKQTMKQMVRGGTKQIPDAELRRIDVPTTLLWGRHDRMAPLHLAEGASGKFGWPLRVIDGAGHVPHLERSEAFLEALRTVLR